MGLRNSNTQNEDKMVNEIRETIAMCRLSPANQKMADEFLDFSKEMDISLLENAQYQDFDKLEWVCRTRLDKMVSDLINSKEEENVCEYRNRLILFLDAVGKDTVERILFDARSKYDYYKESPKAQKRLQVIYDVLSQRYEKHMVAAKIYSLFLHLGSYPESTMVNALFELYQHMKIEYAPELCMAARYCSENLVQKYLMLAAAFSSENCAAYKDEEEVQFALEYIREFMKNTPKQLFEKERVVGYAAAFAASEFDESLLEDLAALDIRVGTLLNAFIYYLPKKYLERRMDVVCRLLQVEENSEKVYENTTLCMQAMLVHLGYDDRNGYESETRDIFYKKMIQNCPKAVVDVIRCESPAKKEFSAYTKGMFFANAYERMYQLIEEEKKEVLSEYQMDFDKDVLNLASQFVFCLGDKKQTKVLSYLLGNCDLDQASEAIPAWAQAYNRNRANHDIVTCCERINKGFAARYASLMVMVKKSYLRECWYSNKKKEEIMNMPELLMRERVPVEKRFQTYADLFDETYIDMTEWYDSVKDFMIKHAEENDADYEKYVKDAPVVARRWYTEYLGFAKNIPNKKERLLAMCGDSSVQVRNTAVNVIAMDKNMEADVILLLKAKKQAVRETAVDILGKWGAAEYKDILSEAAEKEKSAKLADKIHALLDQEGGSSTGVGAGEGVFIASNYVDQLHKGGRAKKLQWLYEVPYQDVKLKNGGKAEEKYLQGILLCYANMDIPGVNKYAVLLAKELDADDFASYVKEVFSRWVDAGAEAKKKWVLYLSAIHGGSDMIEILVKYIKEWSENSRGAIAAEAVRAVAFNGSPEALMQVDYMAHKYKHKQVKNAAILALSQAADELGITSEELLDRIVPNLGFDENFERVFDYGPRKFKVYLSNTLELEIFDENDKKRKSMPAVSAKDDEVMAKAAVSAFRDMKKQLKNVITIQKLRLENAIVSERRWDYENWQKLFVKNPVMHCFAIGLIWSAYEGDKILKTFRYMEDGSFNTSEEEEYTLPENCTIGLTHPIDLSEEELALWKEQLNDYEMIQPIVQLERTVYRMKEEEKQSLDLERFRGRKINGYTILNRTAKFGWSKGSVQDAGVFSTFFREDVQKRVTKEDGSVELIGNAAEFNFSGIYVAGDDEEVEIENVRFYKPGTIERGSYVYDEADDNKAIKLGDISPRYFSEIVYQLEQILKEV